MSVVGADDVCVVIVWYEPGVDESIDAGFGGGVEVIGVIAAAGVVGDEGDDAGWFGKRFAGGEVGVDGGGFAPGFGDGCFGVVVEPLVGVEPFDAVGSGDPDGRVFKMGGLRWCGLVGRVWLVG